MFKLDDNLLIELGLGTLPAVEKNRMLGHIYETLEMRVGMKLAQKMTNEQLDEFEAFIDRNDEAGALKWLESNFPNYKQVVADELESLKAEIKTAAPQIVAASQQQAQMQPSVQTPQPSMSSTGGAVSTAATPPMPNNFQDPSYSSRASSPQVAPPTGSPVSEPFTPQYSAPPMPAPAMTQPPAGQASASLQQNSTYSGNPGVGANPLSTNTDLGVNSDLNQFGQFGVPPQPMSQQVSPAGPVGGTAQDASPFVDNSRQDVLGQSQAGAPDLQPYVPPTNE